MAFLKLPLNTVLIDKIEVAYTTNYINDLLLHLTIHFDLLIYKIKVIDLNRRYLEWLVIFIGTDKSYFFCLFYPLYFVIFVVVGSFCPLSFNEFFS